MAVALPALWMWGFTVDDALISVRYARHLAGGLGYRWNVGGPCTDGVTPLPWPFLLAPMAGASGLTVLARAKAAGLVASVAAGAVLGPDVMSQRAPLAARLGILAATALSVPLAAYAVSGMETPFATLLATLAVASRGRPTRAASLAGLAASLRPELAPWSAVLAAGLSLAAGARPVRVLVAIALALAPFVACAAIRLAIWGSPAPLALAAKPSDLAHGLPYAAAAIVVGVVPIAAVAPFAVARSSQALALTAAALAHLGAIALVGGDWMPYARLVVPVLPAFAVLAALAAEFADPRATALRIALAVVLGLTLVARGGTAGRLVGPDRVALIERARPRLEACRRVAALDVGWVSAATEAAIIDLAGVTDPEVAALPGGHTSKRVDGRMLLDQKPDALLFYAPESPPAFADQDAPARLVEWIAAAPRFPRRVEARLAADPRIQTAFAPAAWLPLGREGAGYVLFAPASRIAPLGPPTRLP